jgi:alanyl-tRNA synthetase
MSTQQQTGGLEWPVDRVRSEFMKFFVKRQHEHIASSPVLPHNDPTLLFINSGMAQFKSIFLGQVDPTGPFAKLKRAASHQKCIRAGGKHNDLDDVGKDVYHHTFFEMLGNWSFGDYFKKEAIDWAWELLTEVYKLSPDRMYATYFGGEPKFDLPVDEEARDLWLRYLPAERVIASSMKDNFWEMGEVGPCGPCSEIHYDRIGGRTVPEKVNKDDPDVLEIWNLVFMQFSREADRSLKKLPAKHVDTGAGLERVTSILQNVRSNYDTDIFMPIFAAIQKETGARPYTGKVGAADLDGIDMAYRVVADHIRTITISIADQVVPSSDGRGYVLRRILRRAVRYGHQFLNAKQGFFSRLVPVAVSTLGTTYPELAQHADLATRLLLEEETIFGTTLTRGIRNFEKIAKKALAGDRVVSGEDIFRLSGTYGFPVDLTKLMADEKNLILNMEEFARVKDADAERTAARSKKLAGQWIFLEAAETDQLQKLQIPATDDEPKYVWGSSFESKVAAIFVKEPTKLVQTLQVQTVQASSKASNVRPLPLSEQVGLVLERTSFYSESGGQVADVGTISFKGGSFEVHDVQTFGSYVLHIGKLVSGTIISGALATCLVDYNFRRMVASNHSSTHQLNFALRKHMDTPVLIEQQGSLVDSEKLRFDCSFTGVMPSEKLGLVEKEVAASIANDVPVYWAVSDLDAARAIPGLRAVFGEHYPELVRVVSIGAKVEDLASGVKSGLDYSLEFCGGTHLQSMGQAQAFCLIQEEGVSKGTRRLTAVTGQLALDAIAAGQKLQARVEACSQLHLLPLETELKVLKDDVPNAVISTALKAVLRTKLDTHHARLLDELKQEQGNAAKRLKPLAVAAAEGAIAAGQSFVIFPLPEGLEGKELANEVHEAITEKLPSVATLVISNNPTKKPKVTAYATVTPELTSNLSAGDWVKEFMSKCGGKGGGKPDTAQGKADDNEHLSVAIQAAKIFAASKLPAKVGAPVASTASAQAAPASSPKVKSQPEKSPAAEKSPTATQAQSGKSPAATQTAKEEKPTPAPASPQATPAAAPTKATPATSTPTSTTTSTSTTSTSPATETSYFTPIVVVVVALFLYWYRS